jgi:glutaminyl-tRNA synthetase
MAVLDPVKLVITNWDEVMGSGAPRCRARARAPAHARARPREFKFGKELWIERTDFEEVPPKGYNRLFPGNKVRLKYGHVIECTGRRRMRYGNVTEVQADRWCPTRRAARRAPTR